MGVFDSIFGSSKKTTQTSDSTANYSNTGTSSVTPTLDPSIAPMMPGLGSDIYDQLNSGNSTSGFALARQYTSLAPAYGQQIAGLRNQVDASAATPSSVTNAIGALQQNPGVAYNGSGVPNASYDGSGVNNVGAFDVGSDQILSKMNPYISAVANPTEAALNRSDAIQLNQMRQQQAGSKAFGDQSLNPQLQLMNNQALTRGQTMGNIYSGGYTSAQAQAEADAQRAQAADVSNQGAGLTKAQGSLTASQSNQQAGLTKAAADLSGQVANAQIGQAGQIAAGNLAQQGQQIGMAGAVANGALDQNWNNTMQGMIAAPGSALAGDANIMYGAPQGQTGTQDTSGTATSHTTGNSKTTNSPSIFQDILGGLSMASGFARGGLMKRADGGALDYMVDGDGSDTAGAFDPAIKDWNEGRVHSSDMGSPMDAPRDMPGLDPQLAVDAAALKYMPPPSPAAKSPDAPHRGALGRFLDNYVTSMTESPFGVFAMGATAEPQSGLVPLSSGMQALQAHKKQTADLALERVQTQAAQQALRERQTLFPFQQRALNDEYGGGGGGNPGAAAASPVGPGSAAAAPGAGSPGAQPGAPLPLSQQWYLKGFNNSRRQAMAGIPGAKEAMTKFADLLNKTLPQNYSFDPTNGTVAPTPGYVEGEAQIAGAKAAAESPYKIREGLAQRAGQAVSVGPNDTVTTGANILGIGGVPGAVKTTGPGSAQRPGNPTPAPGAKVPVAAIQPIDDAPADGADTGLHKNSDGSQSSFWNPATETRIKQFEETRIKATDEARNAQQTDVDLARLKDAFKSMQAKGTQTGYATPVLGQLVAMAKSVGIDTDKLGMPIPKTQTVGDIQAADKVSKVLMGKILKSMYPQRITNVDMMVNKGIAPGPSLDEAANLNLIDQIERQNQYDKNYADEINGVDATDIKGQLNFERNFYKKHGYGPLLGTYMSQGKGGKVSGKQFGAIPQGLPRGSIDTQQVDGKGRRIWQTPDGGQMAVSP